MNYNNNNNNMNYNNNYNNMNFNNNMNNNINTNNIYQQSNNKIYQQNTNNNYNINNNNNNNKNEPPKEVINRNLKDIIVNNEYPYVEKERLKNVILHASSGLKVTIILPEYFNFKELLEVYARKIGVSKEVLAKEVIFIINANVIDINDIKPISTWVDKRAQNIVITVVDKNNILGAKELLT